MQRLIALLPARLRAKLTEGSFGHSVLVMFLGTAMGQLGSVLLSPALTRLFTPHEFGLLGAFTAIVSIGAVVAALRYEMALTLAETEEDALNLLGLCGLALVGTTLLSAVLLATPLGDRLGELAPYKWLIPFGFLAIGAYQTGVYFATRRMAFKLIARTKIYQGYTGPLLQIALGLAKLGPLGLIIGFIVGQSTGSSLLFVRLLKDDRKAGYRMTWARMKALAVRFKNFPLLSSWGGLINAAGTSQLLLVLIPALYSSTIAGFVFLTDRVVGRPLLMISTSILQVYVGDVSKTRMSDPDAVRRRFLQLAGQQLLIVSAWLVLVNALAGFAFPLLFGQEWAEAVPYLHVLSIAYLPQMVVHALVHTLQILERQGLSAFWEVWRLLMVASAFALAAVLHLDALHALLLYSLAQAGAQVVLFGLMYHSIERLRKGSRNA